MTPNLLDNFRAVRTCTVAAKFVPHLAQRAHVDRSW